MELLLRAVAFVESNGGRSSPESDHGYASKLPTPQPSRTASRISVSTHAAQGAQRRKTRRGFAARKQHFLAMSTSRSLSASGTTNRSLHNQMEKSRRAHMRTCQNKLKELVPVGPSGRHTTQGLLIAAVRHIKHLEETLTPRQKEMDDLLKERASLQARLECLTSKTYRESKEEIARLRRGGISPTSSESAASSASFLSQSPSPSSCSEPIDVIGTGSGSDASSDVDEHCCWPSSSDGTQRLVPSTSRLVLADGESRW